VRCRSILTALFAAWLACAGASLRADVPEAPHGVLLVAAPGMPDVRFREAVVLVTQTPDGNTVGVIVNRPGERRLTELMPGPHAERYAEPVFVGGPVLPDTLVALFQSPEPPAAPAFHVLRGVYLSMHPANVYPLVAQEDQRFRLYAGFSGWKPGQLADEIAAGAWSIAAPSEEIVFRKDTRGLWRELARPAEGQRTGWR